MSVADLVIDGILFLIQRVLLPVLPVNLPFLSLGSLNSFLNSDIKTDLIFALSGLENLMPVNLIIVLILSVVFAEISLMLFKMGVFIVNLVRGSGA